MSFKDRLQNQRIQERLKRSMIKQAEQYYQINPISNAELWHIWDNNPEAKPDELSEIIINTPKPDQENIH